MLSYKCFKSFVFEKITNKNFDLRKLKFEKSLL